MAASRKLYRSLAITLHQYRLSMSELTFQHLVAGVAGDLKDDNPKFDTEKFKDWCQGAL